MSKALSNKEAVILRLLQAHGDLYGLELVTHADGELARGTVYVTLGRMVDKGLLQALADKSPKHKGLPRPRYRPTALGSRMLVVTEAFHNALSGAKA